MIKRLIFFITLIIPAILLGQETSLQSYTAFDGTKFSVGDTILIGIGSGDDHVLQSLYLDPAIKNIKLPNTNMVIKRIMTINNNTIFKVKAPSNITSYALDINLALKKNEIILNKTEFKKMAWKRTYTYNSFTDTTAFLYFIKVSKDTITKFSKEYLYLYDRTTYDNIRLDEFEFKKGLRNAQKTIQEKFSQIDTIKTYFITVPFIVSDYDFENQSFGLLGDNGYKWEGGVAVKKHWQKQDLSQNKEGYVVNQTNVSLFFINYKEFINFKIGEDEASSFLKRKKDEDGHINRTVYITIAFNLRNGSKIGSNDNTKLRQESFSSNWYLQSSKYNCFINAEIKEMYVYDSPNFIYNVLGFKTVK